MMAINTTMYIQAKFTTSLQTLALLLKCQDPIVS